MKQTARNDSEVKKSGREHIKHRGEWCTPGRGGNGDD